MWYRINDVQSAVPLLEQTLAESGMEALMVKGENLDIERP
jgi:hypothetical protein